MTNVRWEKDSLLFETFVPSTKWHARHVLRPVSKNCIKQELTIFESWKRTITPEIFPAEMPRPRSESKKIKSKQFMIATKESFEPHSSEQLPASKKVFSWLANCIPEIRVPMREIEVSDTGKSYTGAIEKNAARAAST